MENIQQELINLKREILELKTWQPLPGTSRMYSAQFLEPAGNLDGIYVWTLTFEDSNDTNAPIVIIDQGVNLVLLPYNQSANTQKIEYFANEVYSSFDQYHTVYSTRKIIDVSPITKTGNRGEYSPPASWTQVKTFKLSNMGTTPGMCLQNCRLGFGINTGTYANAISDMQAQKNNGTLHGAKSTPPADIQVPVYINTGSADGHVVVWDKGTVYSDGTKITSGLSYYGMNNVWGWGELCDGVRVVKKS